jgi:lysophospholipase L1-like esterase
VLAVLSRDLSTWLYRGGFLLVAVVCAVLVVAARQLRPDSGVARLLGSWPLRAVGLISYGLYLWHWPVYVVLDPPRTGLSGNALLLTRLVVTFVLAAASYLLLERPLRRGTFARLLPRIEPRLAVAGSAAALVVLAVAVTAGAPRPAPSWADALTAAPAASGDRKVYVLGDSVAWGLASGYRDRPGDGIEVRGSTELGCGLIAVPVVVDGRVEPLQDSCDELDRRWPREVAAYQPDVAVLMLGIGEQFDRRLPGGTVRFGTPAYRDFLEQELDTRVLRLGGARTRPVVLVTVPCHQVLDTGLAGNAGVINDADRTQWLNDVQRDYAARHTDAVRLVDLDGYLCTDGYRNSLHGVGPLRSDGLHFTPQGVRLVWRWLSPRLIDVAVSPASNGVAASPVSSSAAG